MRPALSEENPWLVAMAVVGLLALAVALFVLAIDLGGAP